MPFLGSFAQTSVDKGLMVHLYKLRYRVGARHLISSKSELDACYTPSAPTWERRGTMKVLNDRFLFASAPDSWGFWTIRGLPGNNPTKRCSTRWSKPVIRERNSALWLFTDPEVLQPQLEKRKLNLLGPLFRLSWATRPPVPK